MENIAIIALVNILFFWKTLYYGWVGDDVERSERKVEFKNSWHRRWLQFVGLKHMDSQVSHALTIFCHTICCILIYLAFGRNNVSFIAALLFSLNPANIQGSVWISGRNYTIAASLSLLMLMFPKLSWAFYAATSSFAVNAWFAPLAFLGTSHWYMVGIIPAIWLLSKTNRDTIDTKLWKNNGLRTTNTEMRAIKPRKIIPFCKTFFYYLTLCLFPMKVAIEHDFIRGFGTNQTDNKIGYKKNWLFFAGLVLVTSISIWSGWCILKGWNPVAWGLFWFLINIAMWCNFVTYQQQIAERYVYLANIGLMLAVASVLSPYPVLVSGLLAAYAVRLWFAMDLYINDWWAVEYTIREEKKGSYMWLMRGVKKFMDKDHMGALKDFNEAYQCKPYDLKVLFNLATTCFILGDVVKARDFYEKAKLNVYDELENDVKPAFEQLEKLISQVEEGVKKGETSMNIDMSRIMVVK